MGGERRMPVGGSQLLYPSLDTSSVRPRPTVTTNRTFSPPSRSDLVQSPPQSSAVEPSIIDENNYGIASYPARTHFVDPVQKEHVPDRQAPSDPISSMNTEVLCSDHARLWPMYRDRACPTAIFLSLRSKQGVTGKMENAT